MLSAAKTVGADAVAPAVLFPPVRRLSRLRALVRTVLGAEADVVEAARVFPEIVAGDTEYAEEGSLEMASPNAGDAERGRGGGGPRTLLPTRSNIDAGGTGGSNILTDIGEFDLDTRRKTIDNPKPCVRGSPEILHDSCSYLIDSDSADDLEVNPSSFALWLVSCRE